MSFEPARPVNNTISDIPLVGESILYDVFKRGGELTSDRITKLERMFYSILDRWIVVRMMLVLFRAFQILWN